MKYLVCLLTLLSFQGCLYFNDRGVSGNLYNKCQTYYDANGVFINSCDKNIIDYTEAIDGAVEVKEEIGTFFSNDGQCKDKTVELRKSPCH